MRRLYTFVLYLAVPYLFLRLYWKGRRLPAYRKRISERFALAPIQEADLWLHAVSLGETVAAVPLIEALLLQNWRVIVTTMTPTGSQYVQQRFGSRVVHQYIPYDFPWALKRFFKNTKIRMGIIMETELWPNVIYEAKRAHIPLLLVNARISAKAFKKYLMVKWFFKPLLNRMSAILAQSDDDADRFRTLGASPQIVRMCGNIKFDIPISKDESENPTTDIFPWGDGRTILMAASTHPDEEAQILSRLRTLKANIPQLLLLIAPRHPERFDEVYQLCQTLNFKTGRRSQKETIHPYTDVVVIDSMGELLRFYRQSCCAFVGGSLVPIGGHNVLEPISLGIPVLCGPHMENSKAVIDALLVKDALILVPNADELACAILSLMRDNVRREQQTANAFAVLKANQGTIARYMEHITAILNVANG